MKLSKKLMKITFLFLFVCGFLCAFFWFKFTKNTIFNIKKTVISYQDVQPSKDMRILHSYLK